MIESISEACNGCGICVLACRKDLFLLAEKEGRRKQIAYFTEPRQCVVCYACERLCPVDAIRVGPEMPPEAFEKHMPEFYRLALM